MIARDIILQPEFSIDLEPGVVTLWDLSRYPNDGAMTNVTYLQLPSGAQVMVFNGTSGLINCGNDDSVNVGVSDFSVYSWFRCNSKTTRRGIIGKGTGGAGGKRFEFQIAQTTGRLQATIDDDTAAAVVKQSANDVVDNTWHYGVVTYDRDGNLNMYIDGVVDGAPVNIAAHDTSISGATNLYIGVGVTGTDSYFSGNLSRTGLVLYVLTAGQIRNYYEKTKHWFGVHD